MAAARNRESKHGAWDNGNHRPARLCPARLCTPPDLEALEYDHLIALSKGWGEHGIKPAGIGGRNMTKLYTEDFLLK